MSTDKSPGSSAGSPVAATASDGIVISSLAGQQVTIKVSGASTCGAYSLIEYSHPPGAADLPAHLHRDHEEAFYVIEGELMLAIGEFGESSVTVRAGQAAVVPRGVIHQPTCISGRPVRFLLINSPAMDGFFTELVQLAERSGGQPDAGDLQRLSARYSTIFTALPAGP
jgi:uncharacterized RmlC-like cupin family protein